MRRSEDVLDIFWTSYVQSIYVRSTWHSVKSVWLWSYFGSYFPALRTPLIQPECGKIQTRITLNTDNFYTVWRTHFMLLISFYTTWKQKTNGYLICIWLYFAYCQMIWLQRLIWNCSIYIYSLFECFSKVNPCEIIYFRLFHKVF